MAMRKFRSADEHMDYVSHLSVEEFDIECQNQLNEANESENNSDFEIYVNRYDCTAAEYIREHHLISHEELFNDLLAYSERITYPKKEI